jgi:hypothetical protein
MIHTPHTPIHIINNTPRIWNAHSKNVTADALSNVSIAFLKSYVENSIYEDQQKSKPENYGLLLYRKKKQSVTDGLSSVLIR